jgi:hypothetical protein
LARRVSVPAADELFRPTVEAPPEARPEPQQVSAGIPVQELVQPPGHEPGQPAGGSPAARFPSGRVRHDEKMTVYVTADELLDLEHARLTLRRAGLSVDRGRLVREAIGMALADLEAHGEDSVLVHRLTQR